MPDLKEIANKFETELEVPIYQFDIGGKSYLFRPLTIGELELANQRSDYTELEDYYVEQATVYPEDFNVDKIKAGYITRYADQILQISGFEDIDVISGMMEQHRTMAEHNVIFMMKAYIIMAIPSYKDTDFADLTMEQLVEKLILAENIIQIQQSAAGMDPTGFKLILTTPGQEEEPEPAPLPKQRLNLGGETVIIPPEKLAEKRQAAQKQQPAMTDEEYLQQKRALIAQLKKQDATELMRADSTYIPPDYKALEDLPIESLQHMVGITKADDPIAQKLKANRSKEARVARNIGIPYDD